ncbi:uncharacterized protein PGTG_07503 [Puccinia graminis f. sp. tritici CRL 75-36-700-3]|uniref:Uncharacterized protein n=1 Tax=Puccinia graminis f. sp. tritici (strain CRL 75-36-700-3 / race SCCL) TaxID=418459 RepID=E3KD73_PUCGT|nr:uncharacterized protein PGTG_07503 [Puccinia graminis f. sp. tritici CRL 75-36-700-3]EFP82106.1 hypothetical protein PGTG_07503 [Puccinia graminis f. sp. tritici CRL 75-36-700-3]
MPKDSGFTFLHTRESSPQRQFVPRGIVEPTKLGRSVEPTRSALRSGSRCSLKITWNSIRTGRYDLEKALGTTSSLWTSRQGSPLTDQLTLSPGFKSQVFPFLRPPAVSATAALPKSRRLLGAASEECRGMGGWGPRKTLDRQVLVRLPASGHSWDPQAKGVSDHRRTAPQVYCQHHGSGGRVLDGSGSVGLTHAALTKILGCFIAGGVIPRGRLDPSTSACQRLPGKLAAA